MKQVSKNILEKIEKGEEISPFLFVDKNLEIKNQKIKDLSFEILEKLDIPKVFLYVFEDNKEKIKVEEIRRFIESSNIKTNYKVQIFFIENISRLTHQAGNSLLKFLEEPGIWNLIFLSNSWENDILDTILSRVQIINSSSLKKQKENLFFTDLIKNYLNSNDNSIISYFFKNKLEKYEYINFLENLIIYIKKNFNNYDSESSSEWQGWFFIDYLDEILEDINLIEKNNLNPRYTVDKWILRIKN